MNGSHVYLQTFLFNLTLMSRHVEHFLPRTDIHRIRRLERLSPTHLQPLHWFPHTGLSSVHPLPENQMDPVIPLCLSLIHI